MVHRGAQKVTILPAKILVWSEKCEGLLGDLLSKDSMEVKYASAKCLFLGSPKLQDRCEKRFYVQCETNPAPSCECPNPVVLTLDTAFIPKESHIIHKCKQEKGNNHPPDSTICRNHTDISHSGHASIMNTKTGA